MKVPVFKRLAYSSTFVIFLVFQIICPPSFKEPEIDRAFTLQNLLDLFYARLVKQMEQPNRQFTN